MTRKGVHAWAKRVFGGRAITTLASESGRPDDLAVYVRGFRPLQSRFIIGHRQRRVHLQGRNGSGSWVTSWSGCGASWGEAARHIEYQLIRQVGMSAFYYKLDLLSPEEQERALREHALLVLAR